MKAKFYIFIFSALLLVTSCSLDNFDEPNAMFSGNIVYNGEAIPVARNQVRFQLWQPGYELDAPIDVAIAQDGSFSSRLFTGNYELSFVPGQGPFRTPSDPLIFELTADKAMDIEVTPYHMIRNPQFSHNTGTINASCTVEQIITGADAKAVERVTLIINRTLFVDANSGGEGSIAQEDAADISNLNSLSMSVTIPTDPKKPDQNYVFARIGVKIAGVEDMIYTQVEKIEF
tara:strand:- start:2561 stop:3253 length:693 start_codon:yes stop_codon:yes gene_type:complete